MFICFTLTSDIDYQLISSPVRQFVHSIDGFDMMDKKFLPKEELFSLERGNGDEGCA
jgi:hypothetical protein